MNLRERVGELEQGTAISQYGSVVREERYFCAMLFHLIQTCISHKTEQPLRRFLCACGLPGSAMTESTIKDTRVYVEYAMPRDLWHLLGKREDKNQAKLELINEALKALSENRAGLPEDLLNTGIREPADFNSTCVAGRASLKYIQSPGRWGIKNLCDKKSPFSESPELLLAACKLKWAFNIKPDIVLEIGSNTVVCIEAKVESPLDTYPSSSDDRKLLDKKLYSEDAVFKQTEIQKALMEDVLGFEKVYPVLLANETSRSSSEEGEPQGLAWENALSFFKESGPVIQKTINRLGRIFDARERG